MLKLNLEYHKGILFVRLSGELNRRTCYKLNDYLIPMIAKHKIKYMVYNLYELKKLDEIGVRALQNGKTAVKQNNGFVYMCEIPNEFNKKLNEADIDETTSELTALKLLRI